MLLLRVMNMTTDDTVYPDYDLTNGVGNEVAADVLCSLRNDISLSEIVTRAQDHAVRALLARDREAMEADADTLARATTQLRAEIGTSVRYACAHFARTAEHELSQWLRENLPVVVTMAFWNLRERGTSRVVARAGDASEER